MAKCSVWGCPSEAMQGTGVCKRHFLEDVHRILNEGKRKRRQQQRKDKEAGGSGEKADVQQ